MDMKLEVLVVPVSDVDSAKQFYTKIGWRLDADFAIGNDFRLIQFTPPGSSCSVIFGKNVTAAAPGSALLANDGSAVPTRSIAATARSPRSPIPTAMDGCCRKLRRGCPDGSTLQGRHSVRRAIWRARFDVRRPRMESTRNALAREMQTGPIGTLSTWSPSRAALSCHNEPRS